MTETGSKDRFEVVEVSGEAYERGYQYGSKCKNAIERFVDTWYSLYSSHYKISKDQVLKEARKYIPFIEDYSPEIAEEIRGTAEGSARRQEEIVMMTAFCEMFYGRAFGGLGCTSFAATGPATVNGETYVGQNNDDVEELWMNGESYVLVNFKRKHGPDVLTCAYAGIPAMIGMNSVGVALCCNALACEESKPGVPSMVIVREVLHQKTIAAALGAIIRASRAFSLNFVIGEGNGEVYDVEVTPSDFDYFYVDKFFAHANHFLSKKLKIKKDLILNIHPNTITRGDRLNKLLSEKSGSIDLEMLMEFMKDHVNYPSSICAHVDPSAPIEAQGKTFQSMIFIPAKKEAWITRGNPCQNKYYKYTI